MKRRWLVVCLAFIAPPLLAASADLAISKSDGRSVVAQGETLTYTVIASNLGPDTAAGAAVADILPGDLEGVTWTCSASPGSSCPATGSGNLAVSVHLLANGSATFSLTGTVAADADGTLTNTATVLSPGGVSDPDPSNNSASDSTAITPLVDLSVTLDDGRASAVPGLELSYQLVARNAGPRTADGVQLSSTLAPGLSCAWQCAPSGGASCGAASGSGDLAQTVRLPATARLTYTVDCQIPSQASASLVSSAQIAAGPTSTELELGDNNASHNTPLTPVADVSVAVSDGRTSAVPGADSLTYTVTVRNDGPSDAASVVVQDDFPSALGDLPWSCLPAGSATCAASGIGDLLETVQLPAGTSVSYFASANLPSHLQGTLHNTARATPPNNVSDPDEANNQASDVTQLTPRVDLRLSKTDHVTEAAPGETITYVVQVQNAGPSDAPQSVVLDPLPAPLSCDWTCLASPGAVCQGGAGSAVGTFSQWVDLPAATGVTYELTCAIASDASDTSSSGTLSNTAQVTPAQGIGELIPGDNSATDLTQLTARADLRLSLDDGRLQAVPGESLTYSLEVFNAGPSAVGSAQINDAFPAELSCRWSCVGSGGGQCTSGQVVGDLADNAVLPVAAKVTYTAQCDIASDATGTLLNSATVTSGAVDPFPGDNSASDADTVLTPRVDLRVSNSDGRQTASPGESLTYLLTVANDGPSDAVAAQISNPFAPQLESIAWTCQASGGASCSASGSGPIAESVLVPAGGALAYTATAHLRSDATGNVVTTLQATAAAGTTEVDATDNSATDTTQLVASANLGLSLSDGLSGAVAGETITYQLVVSNAGPADADGASVHSMLSPKLEDVQWTCTPTVSSSCAASGSGPLAETIDLAADGSLTFVITATVASQATGTLSSHATVTAPPGVVDPQVADNSASDIDTVLRSEADLSLTLDDGVATAVPGLGTLYQLTVDNLGPSDAVASRLQVSLPPPLSCAWACQASGGASCAGSPPSGPLDLTLSLPAASRLLYTADCAIDPAAQGDLQLSALASTAAAVQDSVPDNNQAQDVDTLTPRAEVTLSKTDGRNLATPGESLTYTIRVRNLGGPSDAPGVTVSDPFPATLSCFWSCQGQGGAQCSQGQSQGHLLDIAHLPVNGEAVYTAQCDIADDASGTLINSATATLPPGIVDSNGSNNSALDSTTLEPLVDLAIELSDGVDTAVPGEAVTYHLRVRHLAGPEIEDAIVQDIFPSELDCLWTCQGFGGGGCTPGQVQGDIDDTVDLPVAAEVLYSVVCAIAPDARGHLSNTATVELPAGAHDPVAANNSASDLDTELTPRLDVAVTVDDGVTSVAPGGDLVYELMVSNVGPSSVEGVRVEDLFGDTFDCSWTCATFDGATCTQGPIDGDLVDTVDLPAGSHLLYRASCGVEATAGSTLSNTATLELPPGVEDTNPFNDHATDDDTRVEIVTDLSLSLSNGQAVSVPGTVVTYDLQVQRSDDTFAFEPVPGTCGNGTETAVESVPGTCGANCGNTSESLPGTCGSACESVPGTCGNAHKSLSTTTYRLWRLRSDDDEPQLSILGEVTGQDCQGLAWRPLDSGPPVLAVQCRPDARHPDGWRPLAPPTVDADDASVPQPDLDKLLPATVQLTVQSVPEPASSCSWTCVASAGSACTVGPVDGPLNDLVTLASGGQLAYRATCAIASSAVGQLALTAQLVVPPGVIDPTPEDHQSSDSDSLEPRADLHLSKTDGTTVAAPGGSVTYTLVATNPGPSDAPGAPISDIFSPELSCLWSCAPDPGAGCAAGQATGDLIDSVQLPAGSSVTDTAVCAIDADAQGSADGGTLPGGTLANTAQLEAPAGVVELDASDNMASDLDTLLVPQGDLAISLDDDTTHAVAGEALQYTLLVSNSGPSRLDGVTVDAAFDADLTCLWSCQANGGASCAGGQNSGPLADSVFLPATSSVVYAVDCQIAPEARGALLSSATVSPAPGTVDPQPGNNVAQDDDTTLEAAADLSITQSDGVDQVAPGETLVYTLGVHNAGPSSDAAAVVRDLFPASLDCQWQCQPSPGAVCTAGPVTGDLVDTVVLPADGSAVYTATCQLAADASGQLLNQATVTPGDGVTDPDLNNNSASDLDQITPLANLALSQSDGVVEAVPGTSITYTLMASNLGPSDVVQAELRDQVSGLLSCEWTCSSTGNADCGGGPTTGDLDVHIDLPVGGVVTWLGDCAIAADATGTLSNTAVLSPPDGVLDLEPGNNTASDTDTVLVPTADLSVSKDDGVEEALAGEMLTYTMVVRNDGPSDAPTVTVHDPFPTVLSCSWSCQSSAGATCAGQLHNGDLLDTAHLPAASQALYTATCAIAPQAVGEVSNTVTVDGGTVLDPDASNNSATDTDSLIESADLAVQLVDAPDPVDPGGTLLYALQVTNLGPAADGEVSVDLTLPDPIELRSVVVGGPEVIFSDGFESGSTNAWGDNGGIDSRCQRSGSHLTCNLGVLAADRQRDLTLTVHVDAAASGVLILSATVQGAGSDEVSSNDSATEVTTVGGS